MIMNFPSYFTAGRFWIIKAWMLSLIAALTLSCIPAMCLYGFTWDEATPFLPPAYELKADDPFADTSQLTIPADPGSRSHGAKLTPRVFGSACVFLAKKLSLHPYLPASLGGCLLLLAGVIAGYRITGDRAAGLATSLILAGLYATNACFSMNFEPKPFDGVAIGLIALTLILVERPILFTACAFLACFTDERAIMSLGLIGLTIMLRGDMERKKRLDHCWMIAGAVLAYFITRSILSRVFSWSSADFSMVGDNLLITTTYWQLAGWSCFEGAWILILLASWKSQSRVVSVLLLTGALGCVASCLLVLDISRASCFAFPLIFAALAALHRDNDTINGTNASIPPQEKPSGTASKSSAKTTSRMADKSRKKPRTSRSGQTAVTVPELDNGHSISPPSNLRTPLFLAALISLMSTNLEIIVDVALQPCLSTPIWLLLYLSQLLMGY